MNLKHTYIHALHNGSQCLVFSVLCRVEKLSMKINEMDTCNNKTLKGS